MKFVMLTAAALMVSTPAMADTFTGHRVELTAGVDDVTGSKDRTNVTYGVNLGYDFKVLGLIAGPEVSIGNVFDRRDLTASVRAGIPVTDNILVYGKAGYTNVSDSVGRKLSGVKFGAGAEVHLTGPLYTGVEYSYSDLQKNVGRHAVSAKLGVRF